MILVNYVINNDDISGAEANALKKVLKKLEHQVMQFQVYRRLRKMYTIMNIMWIT